MAKSKKKTVKKIAKPSANAKKVLKKTAKKPIEKKTKASKPAVKKSVPTASKKRVDFASVLTPLEDRLLVLVTEKERRTAGGLYLPDTVADSSGNIRGEVVSVGRGRRDKKGKIHPMDVSLGDEVVFSQYSGSKLNLMGQNLIVLHETEVMGIVTK